MPHTDLYAVDFETICTQWEGGTLDQSPLIDFLMNYSGKGTPNFIRDGHTSAKHDWYNTCFVAPDITRDRMVDQVANIIGFNLIHGIGRTNYWAIRQYVEPETLGTTAYGMPLAAEYRFFYHNGEITHVQPYWCPENVDTQVTLDQLKSGYELLDQMIEIPKEIAMRVGRLIATEYPSWSIDVMLTKKGDWLFIDAARAEQSFRWSGKWDQKEVTN